MPAPNAKGFLPPPGNYRDLLAYRKAEIVYDITFYFSHHFLSRGDRTIDQMIQAARSGKQNILEGRTAARTSRETEIKLLNVARASLEELLADYQDYLRVRNFVCWDVRSREVAFVRRLGADSEASYSRDFRGIVETRPPEVVANIAICLIHQANFLLDQLIRHVEREFVTKGGIRELMAKARVNYKKRE